MTVDEFLVGNGCAPSAYERLLKHIQTEVEANGAKAMAALQVQNELGYNAYLERAIALEDLLTWVKRDVATAELG